MTETAPDRDAAQPADAAPRQRRRSRPRAPAGPLDGVALVTIDRPEVAQRAELRPPRRARRRARAPRRRSGAAGRSSSPARGRGPSRPAPTSASSRRQTPISLPVEDRFAVWDRIGAVRTPLIAAVRGFALGGGCELAMSCDMIVAGDDAQFGQPEIKLGVMPGAGGTQRLTRAIGKARAMELILTGRTMRRRGGRGARARQPVVPAEPTLDDALELAGRIAAQAAARRARRQGGDPAGRRTAAVGRPAAASGGRSSCSSRATIRQKAWRPSSRNGRRAGRDADRMAHGGRTMERDRRAAATSDRTSPATSATSHRRAARRRARPARPDRRVGPGQRPRRRRRRRRGSIAESPEHDWSAAERIIFPALRPVGTQGLTATDARPRRSPPTRPAQPLAAARRRGSVRPRRSSTRSTPAASTSSSTATTSSRGASTVERAPGRGARATSPSWSAGAAWTDEVSGERRLISSDTGEGWDASRILLPEVIDRLSRRARRRRAGPRRHPGAAPARRRHPPARATATSRRCSPSSSSSSRAAPTSRSTGACSSSSDGRLVEFAATPDARLTPWRTSASRPPTGSRPSRSTGPTRSTR